LRQRLASIPLSRPALSRRIGLLGQDRQQRIFPQLVVIVQIFIAQRQRKHPLRHKFLHRVLDPLRIAMVGKAGGQPLHDLHPLLHLPQQQSTGVAGDRATVKPTLYFALRQGMKFERFLVTLCMQKAVLLLWQKSFS